MTFCCFFFNKFRDILVVGDIFNVVIIFVLMEGKILGEVIIFGCKVVGVKCGI